MARTDVSYTGDSKVFELALHGSEFVGLLYAKAEGGCDIYIRLWDSELDGLDTERITELRRRADQNKEIYVGGSAASILNPLTVWKARGQVREWFQHNFGLEYGARDRLKELMWKVADLLRPRRMELVPGTLLSSFLHGVYLG